MYVCRDMAVVVYNRMYVCVHVFVILCLFVFLFVWL